MEQKNFVWVLVVLLNGIISCCTRPDAIGEDETANGDVGDNGDTDENLPDVTDENTPDETDENIPDETDDCVLPASMRS